MNENIIGKVFVNSWGYDQTQNDYVVIEALTKSGKSAICRRCTLKTLRTPHMTYSIVSSDGQDTFGPQFKLRIKPSKYDGKIWLIGSYPYCMYGNDCYKPLKELSRMRGYFSEASKEGEYETNPQFGH